MPKHKTSDQSVSEADVIVNRSLLAYAQLRANVAAWSGLPAFTALDEEEDNDEELFVAESETAGVGYTAPKDESGARTSLTANDKLRKQMLGKKGKPEGGQRGPKGRSQVILQQGYSDDDEGRSALGKKRQKAPAATPRGPDEDGDALNKSTLVETDRSASSPSTSSKKRPGSYLDELLAERAKKKMKKKRKQGNAVAQELE